MLSETIAMKVAILSQQGQSVRAIAKHFGISINTVRKYRCGRVEPCYKKRASRMSKLEPYKAYIKQRLADASPDWIPATVLYREIKALGYAGKIRLLRGFMATLKPKKEVLPVKRYETLPGAQMQVDWAYFKLGEQRLYAFVAILGYSRLSYVTFTDAMKLSDLLTCHEEAFHYFGGVPRQILYDNMKTVVLARHGYGQDHHQLQPGFRDFAKHYGFIPKLCKPYRPQSKGKVERFIRYIRESFFIPLKAQYKAKGAHLDQATLNAEIRHWLHEVAHERVHKTLGQSPKACFQEESGALQPCPRPYGGRISFAVPVQDSLIPLTVPPFTLDQEVLGGL